MTTHRNGRARSTEAREAILSATARLFHERGYEHLSIEGIAAAAGVSKQTIYRWWPSRGSLVADCLVERLIAPGDLDIPDTGDVRADFDAWLGTALTFIADEAGAPLLRSLMAAAAADSAVGPRMQERVGANSRVAARIEKGIADGELDPELPVAEITDALYGAIVAPGLAWRPVDPDSLRRLVRHLLGPVP